MSCNECSAVLYRAQGAWCYMHTTYLRHFYLLGWIHAARDGEGVKCLRQQSWAASVVAARFRAQNKPLHMLIRSYCRISLHSVLKIFLSKETLTCFTTTRCKLRHQMRHMQHETHSRYFYLFYRSEKAQVLHSSPRFSLPMCITKYFSFGSKSI